MKVTLPPMARLHREIGKLGGNVRHGLAKAKARARRSSLEAIEAAAADGMHLYTYCSI
jgi:hypothetical protein